MDTTEQWEKRTHLGLNEYEADVAVQLAVESDSLDPKEAARLRYAVLLTVLCPIDFILRWKIDKHILPLMCREY